MEQKLYEHLNRIFEDAPKTKKAFELKEEMAQNLAEKYRDLISQGKSEQEAYAEVIAGIGDIDELLRNLEGTYNAQEEKRRVRSATFTAVAVALYILCVIPVIITHEIAGIITMFIMIAGATGLLVFNGIVNSKYHKKQDDMVEDFKEWKSGKDTQKSLRSAINGALWSITVPAYFIWSFTTGQWGITWVIFLIAAAISSIINIFFTLKK